MLEALLASSSFDSPVPLPMRDAALACHVELRTLRQWVERKEIPAYRDSEGSMWRVYPKDIKAFLTADSNLAPARRARVLRRAA